MKAYAVSDRPRSAILCWVLTAFLLYLAPAAFGEDGMCLVVTSTSAFEVPGNIRRIDFKNNAVINTSADLGFGWSPRFSPDGDRFVYMKDNVAVICEVDGSEVNRFTTGGAGNCSWGTTGIYVGYSGKIYLYNLTGAKQWEKSFPNCGNSFVSQNGVTGTSVVKAAGSDGQTNWRVVIHNIAAGTTIVCGDEQGCSACPSPDGTMTTQNRGGAFSICHLEMRIRKADGSNLYHYYIADVTGLSIANHWCWNSQSWSGNSNDWIVLPVGQTNHTSGCSQVDLNCTPWIYNIKTNAVYRLCATRTNDFWFPQDYYCGKVYDPSVPSLSLSASTVSFAADSGASNPAGSTLSATTLSGALEDVTVSKSASWLTVSLSATSGTSITVTNTVDISGKSPGTYVDTVTVGTSNAGSKTYVVTLVVKTVQVLTSIELDPSSSTAPPDGQARFWATALDQYRSAMDPQPSITWAVSGGGSISSGVFTAGSSEGGPFTVTASSGPGQRTAKVYVNGTPFVHMKINCGDNAYDVSGWERDDAYVSGNGDYVFSQAVSTSGTVNAGPADIYKSCARAAPHTYAFPDLADGTYLLRLHLAMNSTDRLFDYVADDDTLAHDWNPLGDAGGVFKALVKDFALTTSHDQGLTLKCTSGADDVFECGLEIIGITQAQAPITVTSPNGGETYSPGDTMTITWEADLAKTSNSVIVISFDGGLSWLNITDESGVGSGDPEWQAYRWIVPGTMEDAGGAVSTESRSCLVKLYDYSNPGIIQDVSDGTFTIGPGAAARMSEAGGPKREPCSISLTPEALLLNVAGAGAYRFSLFRPDGKRVFSCAGAQAAAYVIPRNRVSAGVYVLHGVVDGKVLRRKIGTVAGR